MNDTHNSDSVLAVARAALALGRTHFPDHAHLKSPKKFTQPQLFAILVVRQYWKASYRRTAVWLAEHPALLEALELKQAPTFTTLKKAEERLSKKATPTRSWPQ